MRFIRARPWPERPVSEANRSGRQGRADTRLQRLGARPTVTVWAVFLVDEVRFEQLVGDALDSLPPALGEMMENIVVVVEDVHPDEDLLGLYEGVPLTERDDYGGMAMPDRVTVYRLPICEICDNEDELLEEIMVTVVHEVAHHFGIDDETLHHLGWD